MVRPTIHTNPSLKKNLFEIAPFKLEEYENTSFAFSCGHFGNELSFSKTQPRSQGLLPQAREKGPENKVVKNDDVPIIT